MGKIPTTLSIDENIKRDFKIECVENGVEMSEAVQSMMRDYVALSREIREAQKELKNERLQ